MELHLLACTPQDVDQLLAIAKQTFRDAFEADNNPEDFESYMRTAFTKESLRAALKDPKTNYFFARTREEIVGYIKINEAEAQSDIKSPDSLELERIYVRKAFQGRQIGAWILNEVKKITIEKKKAYLWLGVWEHNTAAIRFYEKHGFSKFGTHPYYLGKDKQTDWLMRFDILK
ncbi:GNAT family N-acetyltransferase [Spongiimicrobium salis]|uniref:GNAT family N-acetyltransferase n=1 Tax=Spongiimicrobium salis TaxID=1667022 RepID=UPI00374D11BE